METEHISMSVAHNNEPFAMTAKLQRYPLENSLVVSFETENLTHPINSIMGRMDKQQYLYFEIAGAQLDVPSLLKVIDIYDTPSVMTYLTVIGPEIIQAAEDYKLWVEHYHDQT